MSGQIQLSCDFLDLENTHQSLLNLSRTPAENSMRSNIRDISEEETFQIASEGYIFGYPLVLMDVTRRVMSNVARVCVRGAPINQFMHQSQFEDMSPLSILKDNSEMVGSTAWLDLTDEPLILSLPDMGKRYHKMQILDAWTHVFATPERAPPETARQSLITGPNWKGTCPWGFAKSSRRRIWRSSWEARRSTITQTARCCERFKLITNWPRFRLGIGLTSLPMRYQ